MLSALVSLLLPLQEVRLCSAVATLPVGRLSESLSLSHAVVISLAHVFQARELRVNRERRERVHPCAHLHACSSAVNTCLCAGACGGGVGAACHSSVNHSAAVFTWFSPTHARCMQERYLAKGQAALLP